MDAATDREAEELNSFHFTNCADKSSFGIKLFIDGGGGGGRVGAMWNDPTEVEGKWKGIKDCCM